MPRGFGGAGMLAIQGLFAPESVYTGPPFAGGFCLLLAVNLLGAGGAVFCPAGAGEDARAADFAAAEFFRAEDGLLQLGLLGQHGAAKPPADQAAGDQLRANAVQQQALAIQRSCSSALQDRARCGAAPASGERACRPAAARWGQACCIFALLCDELCVRWVVQRNERGLAQALLAPNDQAAVFQLPEDPRGALSGCGGASSVPAPR